MNRKLLISFLVAAVLLFSVTGAIAQSPGPLAPQAPLGTGFTYQGQLQQNGAAVNATCDMAFRLYDAASDGAQVGSAITTTVPVTSGLFTTVLDFGGSAFNGEARWLDIQVRCPAGSGSFTALDPRQALTAVPYALYSLNNWGLNGNSGLSSNNYLGTTDNLTLTLGVNGTAALRIVPTAGAPNLIGGSGDNSILPGVTGATIGGGGGFSYWNNRVTKNYGTVSGGYNNQAGTYTGTTNDAPYPTVGGGDYNTASGYAATVAGGHTNSANDNFATVGGGEFNTAGGDATVAGGRSNTANGGAAVVGGGGQNTATGVYSVVGGGIDNQTSISATAATVAGGDSNVASGISSVVPGGTNNAAQGDYSFAAGRRAKANHAGAFVWGDSTDADVASTGPNQFVARASGGFTLMPGSGSCTLTSGGVGWNCSSDRNLKENFTTVNGKEMLAALVQVPITQWNVRGATAQHIGPMAQDFYAAFHLGEDNRHINTVDEQGVALAAIQGLNEVVEEKDAAIATQQQEIVALEARVTALEQSAPTRPSPIPLIDSNLSGIGALILSAFALYRAQRRTK